MKLFSVLNLIFNIIHNAPSLKGLFHPKLIMQFVEMIKCKPPNSLSSLSMGLWRLYALRSPDPYICHNGADLFSETSGHRCPQKIHRNTVGNYFEGLTLYIVTIPKAGLKMLNN